MGRLWRNGDASLDVDLHPGDRVTVERAGIVYVLGAVNRAGGFALSNDQEQMTVLRAIALAGNFTHDAKPAHAVIIRKTPGAPGEKHEIRVDLKKVLSSQAPDQPLLASDILYVPESGAKADARYDRQHCRLHVDLAVAVLGNREQMAENDKLIPVSGVSPDRSGVFWLPGHGP